MGTVMDVSERVRAQLVLAARDRLVRESVNLEPEAFLRAVLDELGALVESPIGFFHLFNAEDASISLKAWSTRTVQDFCTAAPRAERYPLERAGIWADCVRRGEPVIHNDYPNEQHRRGLPPGHAQVSRELVVPVSRAGRIVAILGVGNKPRDYVPEDVELVGRLADFAWDIAERRFLERQRRDSEAVYQSLFSRMDEGFAVVQVSAREPGLPVCSLLELNPALERQLVQGASSRGSLTELMGDHGKSLAERCINIARTGSPDTWKIEIREGHYEVRGFPVTADRVALLVLNVTERHRAQEMAARSERLDALSRMAGGVAHEFNNLLGGLFGSLELAEESLREGDAADARDQLRQALGAFDRARELGRRLLTFARGGEPRKTAGDLGQLIRQVAQSALADSGLAADLLIPSNLWRCEFDPQQIAQVVEILVRNAREWSAPGGALEISASNEVLAPEGSEPAARGAPLPPGRYVRFNVRDHGAGIPSEVVHRVFDPFFSTRAAGVGLGLPTAHSIVHRHGGDMLLESAPGLGTCVSVFIPARPPSGAPRAALSEPSYRAEGRVLLMDDEPTVRAMVSRMLERAGFNVVATADGAEAAEVFAAEFAAGRRFRAAILDLTVPGGVGGKVAAERILRVDPQIPLVVASGYADDPIMAEPGRFGFSASVGKPFRQSELMRAVELAIERRAQA
jgi:signal transduction histidine kinase/ActR/RegA family two-component response regulator